MTVEGTKTVERGVIRRVTERRAGSGGKDVVHVHWLKEVAVGDRAELFLQDVSCQDVSLNAIREKLDFALLAPHDPKPRYSVARSFCRSVWVTMESLTGSLIAQSDHRLRDHLPPHEIHGECDSCVRKDELRAKPSIDPLLDEIRFGDEVLHQNDFLMIESGRTGVPLLIGQLMTTDEAAGTVEVRMLGRHVDLGLEGFKDEVSRTSCAY